MERFAANSYNKLDYTIGALGPKIDVGSDYSNPVGKLIGLVACVVFI